MGDSGADRDSWLRGCCCCAGKPEFRTTTQILPVSGLYFQGIFCAAAANP
jgi:hypothetical protein